MMSAAHVAEVEADGAARRCQLAVAVGSIDISSTWNSG